MFEDRPFPKPSSGVSLRRRISRSNQFSNESGSRRWLATLTANGPYAPSGTGAGSRSADADENPALRFVGPLHRCADRGAALDVEVLTHADLLAVEEHRACPAVRTAGCTPCVFASRRRRAWAAAGDEGRVRRPASAGSGPNASNTSCRSSSLSLSSVSSSWLRTNVAHWQSNGTGGRSCIASISGCGIAAGKREVETLHQPEVEDEMQLVAVFVTEERPLFLRGQVHLAEQHRVAAADVPTNARRSRRYSCGSTFAASGNAFDLDQEGDGVDRNPETPSSSQNPMIRAISSRTFGFATLRSGWWP